MNAVLTSGKVTVLTLKKKGDAVTYAFKLTQDSLVTMKAFRTTDADPVAVEIKCGEGAFRGSAQGAIYPAVLPPGEHEFTVTNLGGRGGTNVPVTVSVVIIINPKSVFLRSSPQGWNNVLKQMGLK